ncbi:MAG: hypothetical protein GX273_04050 [Bacteroidales bacterium]|nr:hypothetical protein [Bacteroidales bacterium]
MNDNDQYAYQWGNVQRYFRKGHSDYIVFSNNFQSSIRYSKDHGAGKYWYSIVPSVIVDYKNLHINSHIFCFSNIGSVNLPIELLDDYLKTADTTPDIGPVQKYHVRIQLIESAHKCFLYTGDKYYKDVSEYLKLFRSDLIP